AGLVKKGWYKRATTALRALFGQDTETFGGVLAATSPRQTVTLNLKMALDIYGEWIRRGRPLDDKNLHELAMMGNLPSRYSNIIRAFKGEPLHSNFAEGIGKAPYFHDNLMGSTRAVTNDVWIGVFAGLPENALGRRAAYLATTAKTRSVAEQMNWAPREVQETAWSFWMALANYAGKKYDLMDILPLVNDEIIRQHATEFTELLRSDEDVRAKLKTAGIDIESLERAKGLGKRRAPSAPLQSRVETGPGSALRRASERIDAARRAGRTALKEEPQTLFEREPGEEIEPQREPKSQKLSDALVDKFGTTHDPLRAGFLLRDGRMVPLTYPHPELMKIARGADFEKSPMLREDFIHDEGVVRTRYR